ncbi:hypothetical protein [Bacillus thuringiensis]|uniref:hypothetical protein n=1 Tax=Bacillus thuringiensis TaxID=1428 RepID=UPI00301A31B1
MNSNFNPLLHMNLFLHMCMEYPEQGDVYPYFYKKGYRIKLVSPKIVIPLEVKHIIEKKLKCKINQEVAPEIVFEHNDNNEILLLECKLNGFNVDYSHRNTKQALGYLSLPNEYVVNYLGNEKAGNVKLLYSVLQDDIIKMNETLCQLGEILNDMGKSSLPHQIFGIHIDNESLYLSITDMSGTQLGSYKIMDGTQLEDSIALYIIPLDPEINLKDKYGRAVLEQKIRNKISVLLGKYLLYREVTLSPVEICKQLIPVWDMWESQSKSKITVLVRTFISEMLKSLCDIGIKFERNSSGFTVDKLSRKKYDKLIQYLASAEYNKLGKDIIKDKGSEQLSLFNE